jgi:phosphoserine phosphatase
LKYSNEIRRQGMNAYLEAAKNADQAQREAAYKLWCNYCCGHFKKRGLRRSDFKKITRECSVIEGFQTAAHSLQSAGVQLAVISGGIDAFLETMLPNYRDYFGERVYINRFVFGSGGRLARIEPTPYDFQGKAACIEMLCQKLEISKNRVAFIGEGLNDEFVRRGNVGLTIALTPRSQVLEQQADVVIDRADFREVLPHIFGLAQRS